MLPQVCVELILSYIPPDIDHWLSLRCRFLVRTRDGCVVRCSHRDAGTVETFAEVLPARFFIGLKRQVALERPGYMEQPEVPFFYFIETQNCRNRPNLGTLPHRLYVGTSYDLKQQRDFGSLFEEVMRYFHMHLPNVLVLLQRIQEAYRRGGGRGLAPQLRQVRISQPFHARPTLTELLATS